MRVLIYSHVFAPSIGGVETIVQSLARGLDDSGSGHAQIGCRVTVVTQTASNGFDDSAFSFTVVRCAGLAKLWKLIRENDVIHIAGPSLLPLFLGFLARKPVIVEHHGYQAICPNGLLTYLPNRSVCPGHFQARRYRKCFRCQSCELSLYGTLVKFLLMFPRSWLVHKAAKNLTITRHVNERHRLPRSEVVYYGIEDPLSKEALHPAINPPDRIIFAFVGRLVREKGIRVLLEAARQLVSEQEVFEIRLVGDGPERTALESIIRRDRLEGCVRITGFLTGAALVDALRNVGVVVMPSVWEETAGLAAIEHMMRGRVVIASEIGGLSEVVGNSGLRFAPGNSSALAECMRRVLHHSAWADELGRSARVRALSLFARRRMIDEHRHVYREALKNAPTGASQNSL